MHLRSAFGSSIRLPVANPPFPVEALLSDLLLGKVRFDFNNGELGLVVAEVFEDGPNFPPKIAILIEERRGNAIACMPHVDHILAINVNGQRG